MFGAVMMGFFCLNELGSTYMQSTDNVATTHGRGDLVCYSQSPLGNQLHYSIYVGGAFETQKDKWSKNKEEFS